MPLVHAIVQPASFSVAWGLCTSIATTNNEVVLRHGSANTKRARKTRLSLLRALLLALAVDVHKAAKRHRVLC